MNTCPSLLFLFRAPLPLLSVAATVPLPPSPPQIFGCVLCAVGSYALNDKVAAITGATLPQGQHAHACTIIHCPSLHSAYHSPPPICLRQYESTTADKHWTDQTRSSIDKLNCCCCLFVMCRNHRRRRFSSHPLLRRLPLSVERISYRLGNRTAHTNTKQHR